MSQEKLQQKFAHLDREGLLKLLSVYAHNWLAHDGCWFLACENRDDLETAIELDIESWRQFTVAEAKRIMRTFDIAPGGGLKALEKAVSYRLYACVNEQEISWDGDALIYHMRDCRVQTARRRKGLADFPCKPVGMVEYGGFARTIDPRIETECIQCPPDDCGETACIWRFTLREEQGES
ncbi:MAG: DUF6125 family protein [Candidatus Lernaella stagnicola]|nr:DUF6125 family protein [Candidatus Lernaella stagnicola]